MYNLPVKSFGGIDNVDVMAKLTEKNDRGWNWLCFRWETLYKIDTKWDTHFQTYLVLKNMLSNMWHHLTWKETCGVISMIKII